MSDARKHIEQASLLAKAAAYYLDIDDYGKAERLLADALDLIKKAREANG